MFDTSGPRCPNHDVPLTDCHDGVGICPISGCRFAYTAEESNQEQEITYDKFGQPIQTQAYKIVSLDGEGG